MIGSMNRSARGTDREPAARDLAREAVRAAGVASFLSLLGAAGVAAQIPAHQWSHRYGSWSYDSGMALAVDGSGNVVVTGRFHGPTDFGGGALPTEGEASDVFLAKYDTNGNHQWSRGFGGTSHDFGKGVAVDGSGGVLVTGDFQGTADFGGPDPLVSAGGTDIYLAAYNLATGAHLWSRSFGSTAQDEGHAIAVGGGHSVVLTGLFRGSVNFGGIGNLASAGLGDIFVAKYLNTQVLPIHLWSKRFGGVAADAA